MLTVIMNVHKVRQFNQRNKTTKEQTNNNQQQSSNQQPQNNNDYMTQDEINEWNKINLLHMMNLKWDMDAEIMKSLKKQVKSKKRSKCTRWWSRLG